MKCLKTLTLCVVLVWGISGLAQAQNTFDQDVTIVLNEINVLSVSGDVSMTISTATAGSAPTDATDNSTTYNITNNGTLKKLTASLDAAYASGISLDLDLTAPTGGSSTEKTLTAVAQDLVTGINRVAESSLTIAYTASATVNAVPNGAGETQTVTVTLTAE